MPVLEYNPLTGRVTRKPDTNADRIRAMRDDELAEWLHYICDQYYEPDNGWLDWLKKSDASPFEVEE